MVLESCLTPTEPLNPVISPSPAHGVVVLRVTETGGFQLAAHHRAGAFVSRQVALQATLTVHSGPFDKKETPKTKKGKNYQQEFSCLLCSVFIR